MHRGAASLALLLLLVATVVGIWDWWVQDDLRALSRLCRVPLVGSTLEDALGARERRPSLTVAVDASYPPFAAVDSEGRLVGLEVDLARELGRRIADRWQVVNLDASDSLLDALATGKVHAVLAGLTYMPEKVMDLAFSDGYFEAGPMVLVREGDKGVRGPGDLARKRVAVEIGSVGEGEAHKLQGRLVGMEVVPMLDVERVLEAVVEGEAEAAVVDRASIPLGSPLLERVRPAAGPLRSQPYVIAVLRAERELVLAINRHLAAMRADGTLADLERRWFGWEGP